MATLKVNHNGFIDLALLNEIDADPDVSQAALAEDLGIAIGTVNWHLKRMVENGNVKAIQTRRRKLRYIITAEGYEIQKALTEAFVQQSFMLYRQVRQQVIGLLAGLNNTGIHTIRLVGEGDIADVCRLTCVEQKITLTHNSEAPALVVDGLDIRFEKK